MHKRIEKMKSGKYLLDHNNQLYPVIEDVVVTRINNPQVAYDRRHKCGIKK